MTNQQHNHSAKLGGLFLIIGWIITLGLISLLLHQAMYSPKAAILTQTDGKVTITLSRDYDSHFRIPGTINGVQVNFLVDTGASTIAISDRIAKQARLSRLAQIATQTAAGTGSGYLTRIPSLKIGDLEFTNLSAVIIPDMHGVDALLGMNALKHFEIQQRDNQMVLTYR